MLNHLPTAFPASCLSTQNLPYTSTGNVPSKNTSEDFNQLPTERSKSQIFSLEGGVFHVPTSCAILVPSSLYDPGIILHTSLSLAIPISAPFMTNSNTTFPTTLPSNFFAFLKMLSVPHILFQYGYSSFQTISSFGREAEILRVLGIPQCLASRRLSINVCHFAPRKSKENYPADILKNILCLEYLWIYRKVVKIAQMVPVYPSPSFP